MTFNSIVLKMLKVNFRSYTLYLLCNVFSVLFLLLFFSIYYNDQIELMKQTDSFDTALAIPAAALLLFMLLFLQYSHSLFIKNRKSEFGIFQAIGMSPNNVVRLVMVESLIISFLSLVFGLLTGGVFSRLFFLIFSFYSKMDHDFYNLSFRMLKHTAFIYLFIFWIIVIISIVQIKKSSLLQSIQSDKEIDNIKPEVAHFGLVGLIMLFVSIIGLFLTYETYDNLLMLWALMTFLGLYILLSGIISFLLSILRKNPKLYYRSILLFSSLEQKQKKVASIITLTCMMIMVTTLYCTITLSVAREEYERIQRFYTSDVAFLETELTNNITEEKLSQLFENEGTSVVSHIKLPVIEISKPNYYSDLEYYEIVSMDDYNRIHNKSLLLKENEFFLFINEEKDYVGDFDIGEQFEIGPQQLTQKGLKIEKKYTWIGNSNVYLIVHPTLWEKLLHDNIGDTFFQNFIQVENWKLSFNATEQLKTYFNNQNRKLSPDVREDFEVSSKIERYTDSKMQNATLFYLMTFLSILFFFGAFTLLYLHLLANIEMEKKRFDKLFKIGITKRETKQFIMWETLALFFIPTFLGITLAFCYILAMVQDIGGIWENRAILIYFLKISFVYLVIQLCFFFYTKATFFQKVWKSLKQDSIG